MARRRHKERTCREAGQMLRNNNTFDADPCDGIAPILDFTCSPCASIIVSWDGRNYISQTKKRCTEVPVVLNSFGICGSVYRPWSYLLLVLVLCFAGSKQQKCMWSFVSTMRLIIFPLPSLRTDVCNTLSYSNHRGTTKELVKRKRKK